MGDNQTDPKKLEGIKETEKGSGVFAIPNPAEGAEAISKVIVNNITYEECVRRGRPCLAFKWVPSQLPNNAACPSQGQLCVKTCAHDTCLCVDGRCQ